jgi:NADPH:quinone reductase-like Zn-dependent oxidoreductase
MRISAGLRKPKDIRVGVDFAGTVEGVGRNVTKFKPGDEVFGGRSGAFAEYVTIGESRAVALKPAAVTFEQAASVPIAALTALQGIRDHAKVQAGQKVLINGASGGVGTFAVQIAKSYGAEVTGVCSTRNLEMVRSIGADHVIDYTRENYTEGERRYDVIIDNVGNHPLLANKRVLEPDGKFILIGGGGPDAGNWVGPLAGPVKMLVLSPFVDQELRFFVAQLTAEDLALMGELIEAGTVRPVIDRRYPLSEVPAALAYLEDGHARGKVIIIVE